MYTAPALQSSLVEKIVIKQKNHTNNVQKYNFKMCYEEVQ